MRLVRQKINKSIEQIKFLQQSRKRKIHPIKLKIHKGSLDKSQGKYAKLKTQKGSSGKNKGMSKEKREGENKRFWLYTWRNKKFDESTQNERHELGTILQEQ